jgi:hypothetical protein
MISVFMGLLIGDFQYKSTLKYSEIIESVGGEQLDRLLLWMGFFSKVENDGIELLMSREAHLRFFTEQKGLRFSEKLNLLKWSRQIQRHVQKLDFRLRVIPPSTNDAVMVQGKESGMHQAVPCPEPRSSIVHASSQAKDARGAVEEARQANPAIGGYRGDVFGGDELSNKLDRISYKPININNNYHQGFLYYPVLTVRQQSVLLNKKYVIHECLEAVVVRSDRMVLNIEESDRPEGLVGEKILRLSDGTLIQKRPTSNGHSSWDWDSIQNFLENSYKPSKLTDLISIIHQHLYSRVWLPEESDYWMLTIAVVVTYTQAIFDSVPLFILTGPAGSGKSELSGSMAEVSANSVMIGQTSAPTMMRLIDESGGLVIIDDLESVGVSNKGGKNENVSDIAQALKVSYKKSSATRLVTNPKTMRTEILNFYGVKIISNTRSVDSILGSRMLHISTRHMPEGLEDFKTRRKVLPEVVKELRNQLHIWAFENVSVIRKTYLEMYSDKTNRDDEIAAPLRVIAHLTGDPSVVASIETALSLQAARKADPYSPEDLVREALEVLVLSGYRAFTITHLMLEMRRMAEPNLGKDHDGEIPVWNKPEWVGRYLRSMDVIDAGKRDVRKRIKGSNLRVSNLTQAFIKGVLVKHKRSFMSVKNVDEFCGDCSTCPFSEFGCEIMLQQKA